MQRLGELTAQQRTRLGIGLLVMGTLALAVGVVIVHWALLPHDAVVDTLDFMPRGWLPKSAGYLVAFVASQMMLAGAAIGWVLGRRMTWATATFAAFIAWIELVLIFGIVPSEWLNLAQTDLDWSTQRIAFTLPSWLMLGNEVDISWGAIKDMISGGYNVVALVGAAVFAYRLQEMGRPSAAAAPVKVPTSPYGRPLLKADE